VLTLFISGDLLGHVDISTTANFMDNRADTELKRKSALGKMHIGTCFIKFTSIGPGEEKLLAWLINL